MKTESNRHPVTKINSADTFLRLARHERMPRTMFARGTLPDPELPIISVVGTRSPTEYGISCIKRLIADLSGHNVIIASGLAYGLDGVALEAAVGRGMRVLAYPGSGIQDDALYPRVHLGLAHRILESGGCIVSHFTPSEPARPYFFPERNRVLAALSSCVVVGECMVRSGTMITAMAGVELGADVGTIPGDISSVYSAGPHELLRRGAFVVESGADVLDALGLRTRIDPFAQNLEPDDTSNDSTDTASSASGFVMPSDCSPIEQTIMNALTHPLDRDSIAEATHIEPAELARWLSVLELKGHVEYIAGRVARIRR